MSERAKHITRALKYIAARHLEGFPEHIVCERIVHAALTKRAEGESLEAFARRLYDANVETLTESVQRRAREDARRRAPVGDA